jgi:K+-sensing histidine kinase KdpD
MPASAFDVPDTRAGSGWLARESPACQGELLAALLSRFNHDLRTPLNTVVSWAHLLQQGKVDSARSTHVADVLARNAREQAMLLDEYVDDARAVLGVMKLDPVALPFDGLVAREVERAAPTALPHGVSFAVRPDGRGAEVEADARRLPRLLHRLLVAVAHRAPQGAVVEVSSCLEDGSVVLRIEGPVADGDWSDAALLDLRIGSFVAALHGAALSIDGTPRRAAIVLQLPAHS